jgi:hypothetical protein
VGPGENSTVPSRDGNRSGMRIFVLGLALAACGKSSAPLDCAWLAGDNCWKATLAEASSCLPGSGPTGTFSPDRQSCSYTGSPQVTFTSAVPNPVPQDQLWNFTLAAAGQTCVKLEQPDGSTFRLTTSAGTVTATTSGADEVVTCPDGKSYAGDGLTLLQCASLNDLPGAAYSYGTATASLSLLGGQSSNGAVHVFTCQ